MGLVVHVVLCNARCGSLAGRRRARAAGAVERAANPKPYADEIVSNSTAAAGSISVADRVAPIPLKLQRAAISALGAPSRPSSLPCEILSSARMFAFQK